MGNFIWKIIAFLFFHKLQIKESLISESLCILNVDIQLKKELGCVRRQSHLRFESWLHNSLTSLHWNIRCLKVSSFSSHVRQILIGTIWLLNKIVIIGILLWQVFSQKKYFYFGLLSSFHSIQENSHFFLLC